MHCQKLKPGLGESVTQPTSAIPGIPLNPPAKLIQKPQILTPLGYLITLISISLHPNSASGLWSGRTKNTSLLKDTLKGSAPTLHLAVQPASSMSSHTAEQYSNGWTDQAVQPLECLSFWGAHGCIKQPSISSVVYPRDLCLPVQGTQHTREGALLVQKCPTPSFSKRATKHRAPEVNVPACCKCFGEKKGTL